MLEQDVKLLVLACNTATSRALTEVRRRSEVPVLGVVRPGAVAAAAATRAGTVGVIATSGTVESGAYHDAIVEADAAIDVAQLACPELVPMVEAGILDGRRAESVLRAYLEPLHAAHPGWTPCCSAARTTRCSVARSSGSSGPEVAVVDSAFTTALAVEDLLDALGARAPSGAAPIRRVATTGDVDAFVTVARGCSAMPCRRSSRSRSGPRRRFP